MLYNPRNVSLLIGLVVALLTSGTLFFNENVSGSVLFTTFLVALVTTFIFTYITLDFFIFSEINRIFAQLEKLKKRDFSKLKKNIYKTSNPLRRINEEIKFIAFESEAEINELKKLVNFRREFLADVSHELKTPIFATQGYIHTLIDGAIDDVEVRDKFLKKAAKTLDDIDVLVHDLISISQIESGELKMHLEPVNLKDLLSEVFEKYEDRAKEKNVKLLVDAKKNSNYIVSADPKWLKQVLNNLIENAINYGNDNGTVIVILSEHKTKISIEIADNGPGIAPEHQKRIFERFYRVEKSRNKGKGGSGLGLSIVKHIIEAHESKIKLESTEGKGTSFIFSLKKEIN